MIDDIKYTLFGILVLAILFLVVGFIVYLSETKNERIVNIRGWMHNIAAGITAFWLLFMLLYLLHEFGKSLYTKIF